MFSDSGTYWLSFISSKSWFEVKKGAHYFLKWGCHFLNLKVGSQHSTWFMGLFHHLFSYSVYLISCVLLYKLWRSLSLWSSPKVWVAFSFYFQSGSFRVLVILFTGLGLHIRLVQSYKGSGYTFSSFSFLCFFLESCLFELLCLCTHVVCYMEII